MPNGTLHWPATEITTCTTPLPKFCAPLKFSSDDATIYFLEDNERSLTIENILIAPRMPGQSAEQSSQFWFSSAFGSKLICLNGSFLHMRISYPLIDYISVFFPTADEKIWNRLREIGSKPLIESMPIINLYSNPTDWDRSSIYIRSPAVDL